MTKMVAPATVSITVDITHPNLPMALELLGCTLPGVNDPGEKDTQPARKKPEPKAKPEPEEPMEDEADEDGFTLEQLKAAAKAAKEEYGVDHVSAVLDECGYTVKGTVNKTLATIDAEDYAAVIEALGQAPEEEEGETDEEWDEEVEITPEAVTTVLKAYATEHGKPAATTLIKKHGGTTLASIKKMNDSQLKAIYKECESV